MAATRQQTGPPRVREADVRRPRARGADAAAAKIVVRLRSQIDQLTEAAMGEIFAGIPAYETTVDPAFVVDVREHVREHYEAVFDGLEADRTVTPEDLVSSASTRRSGSALCRSPTSSAPSRSASE